MEVKYLKTSKLLFKTALHELAHSTGQFKNFQVTIQD